MPSPEWQRQEKYQDDRLLFLFQEENCLVLPPSTLFLSSCCQILALSPYSLHRYLFINIYRERDVVTIRSMLFIPACAYRTDHPQTCQMHFKGIWLIFLIYSDSSNRRRAFTQCFLILLSPLFVPIPRLSFAIAGRPCYSNMFFYFSLYFFGVP